LNLRHQALLIVHVASQRREDSEVGAIVEGADFLLRERVVVLVGLQVELRILVHDSSLLEQVTDEAHLTLERKMAKQLNKQNNTNKGKVDLIISLSVAII
jgi:hypothetical protein